MKANKAITFKRKLVYAAVASCFSVLPAYGNPIGATVVNGSVSFATQNNTLNITNTPNAIINWQQFNIQVGQTTRFIQQSAQSAVLNRVVGQDPSQILGSLLSNGRVFLINPNGIVFGADAIVDVAGLVASTLRLSDGDFLAGRMNFTDGVGAGSIVNQGNINTPTGGNIYLIAPDIQNSGIITSPQGEILLAAGHTVNLMDVGNPNVQVSVSAPATQAINLGTLMAQSGKIGLYASLINQSGVINADSAVLGENGVIRLQASQDITLQPGSSISARGGGTIEVLADMANGQVNVDGLLDASAPDGGDGGFIETSAAHVMIADTARVTTLAAYGNNGTWLIDPNDFTIAAALGDITGAALSTALGGGNVTILSSSGATPGNGDIFVNDNVGWSANTILTLSAVRNIDVTADIIATGPTSGITLNAGGMVTIQPLPAPPETLDDVIVSAGNIVVTAGGLTVQGGTAVVGVSDSGSASANATLNANGNMTLTLGAGGLTVQGGTATGSATDSSSISISTTANAKLHAGGNLDITISSGGGVLVSGGSASAQLFSFMSDINLVTASTDAELSAGGNLSLTMDGGDVIVRGGDATAYGASVSSGTNNVIASANALLSAGSLLTITGASGLAIQGGAATATAFHELINNVSASANASVSAGTLTLASGDLLVQGGSAVAIAGSSCTASCYGGIVNTATVAANANLQASTISVLAGSLTVQGGSASAYTSASASGLAILSATTYTNATVQAGLLRLAGPLIVLPGTAFTSGVGAFAFANAVSSPAVGISTSLPDAVIEQLNFTVGEINRSAPPRILIEGIRYGDEGEEDYGKPECS